MNFIPYKKYGLLFSLFFLIVSCSENKLPEIDQLVVHLPFRFSDELEPRNIVTVGDQVLSEYVFAAHAIRNPKHGQKNVFSKIRLDNERNILELELLREVLDSNGKIVSFDTICHSFEKSIRGTTHFQLSKLVKKIECSKPVLRVFFEKLPLHAEAIFSLPDFFIFDDQNLPIKEVGASNVPTTGPYSFQMISENRVLLKRNIYYPEDLTANKVNHVELRTNLSDSVEEFLREILDSKYIMAYFGGYYVTNNDLKQLESKNLIIKTFPSEWLMTIGFNNSSMSVGERNLIATHINKFKEELKEVAPLMQPAYSIVPIDRPYALSKEDEMRIAKNLGVEHIKTLKTIGILERDKNHDLIKELAKRLETIKNIKVQYFDSSRRLNIFTETDMYVGIKGMSTGDPTGHYRYYLKFDPLFKEVVSYEELNSLAIIDEKKRYNAGIKNIEEKFARNRTIIPVAHFPGIVIHSRDLILDEDLIGDWGIRAWTYQILR